MRGHFLTSAESFLLEKKIFLVITILSNHDNLDIRKNFNKQKDE